jgi:glycosyltransferase involved in cell wall biosynthesis
MKLMKYILLIITLIILSVSLIYIVKMKRKYNILSDEFQLSSEELNRANSFTASLLSSYDKKLSYITKEDYKNAQKSPKKTDTLKFCIVISSYNNIKYASQNLNSIFKQNYNNWRIKYFDDSSDDGMSELVSQIKLDSGLSDNKFLLVRHPKRLRSASYNIYEAAHNFCSNEEVMVLVDGDDMLATDDVLKKLAQVYKDNKIWLTYGSFIQIPSGDLDSCCNNIINKKKWSKLRSLPWSTSHLRTAYTWLFKKINVNDLKYKGEFMKSAWDKAFMYPMLEMAGKNRIQYTKDILYLYRVHPKNDHKLYRNEQDIIDKHVLKLAPYTQIEYK